MATLGNTTNALSGWTEPGTGYAFATSFTTPAGAGIVITNVHAYMDLATGTGTGYVCVWNSTGTLLCSASVGSMNVKTGGVGNALDWWTAAVTPTYVAASTAIWIGGYTAGSLLFNSESGGSSTSRAWEVRSAPSRHLRLQVSVELVPTSTTKTLVATSTLVLLPLPSGQPPLST